MKKMVFVLSVALLIASCAQDKNDLPTLKPDEPAYKLAKELAADAPFIDPDSDTVIVKTNSFIVTANQTMKKIYDTRGNATDRLKGMSADRLKNIFIQSAQQLTEEQLLLQAAKKAGIKIPQAEMDSLMQAQFAHAGGEDKFKARLTENGVDFENVKQSFINAMNIQRYLDDVAIADYLKITDEDLQQAYDNNKTASVQHILMMTQGKSDEEKQKIHAKMENVLKQAKRGVDFGELAKKNSEDPGSKDKGGLYENFHPGEMVKPFEDASFSVPIGEISDIVETRYGYHIIKVVDRKVETRPMEEIRGELEALALKEKNKTKNVAYGKHVEELRNQAGFEIVLK
ncbi:peptidylprolyl isomerase [candidate division KSB1 bacterium]|nr:peptidylprolyl isomerase [candidate division KSB1 bacterium]